VFDETLGSILVYQWFSPWVEATESIENYGVIYDVQIDLYKGYDIETPYRVEALFQERETGSSGENDLGSDVTWFTVASEMTSSTSNPILTPFPTSTPSSTTGRADCGDWYQFNLSCHLENFSRYLFQPKWTKPNTGTISPFTTLYEGYMAVFPFNLFTVQREYYLDELNNSSNTVSDLAFAFNIGGQTSSIKVAGGTFLEDTFGDPVSEIYFNLILVFFTLVVFSNLYHIGYNILR